MIVRFFFPTNSLTVIQGGLFHRNEIIEDKEIKMKFIWTSVLSYRVVRITLGGIFIVSGAIKSMDPAGFSQIIEAFAIIGPGMSYPTAVLIIFSELILGIGLVADIKGSLGGISGLLLGFVLVLGWALYMGYDIDCGCFGPQDPESKAFSGLRTALARDAAMLLSAGYLYLWRWRNDCPPRTLNLFRKMEKNR